MTRVPGMTAVRRERMNDEIQPLGLEEPTMTSSGFVLPETAKEKPQRGAVVAVVRTAAVAA